MAPKPKPKMMTRADMDRSHGLIAELQALEHKAHQLGFPLVGQVLNNAKNTLGWELAGDTEMAILASRGRQRAEDR